MVFKILPFSYLLFSVIGFSFYCAPGVSSFSYFILYGAPPCCFWSSSFSFPCWCPSWGYLCLQMVYVEHDQAISISFESTKSPCPWCLWCYAGLCWRFCSARISSLSFSDRCYGSWKVCWCLYQSSSSTLSHIGAQIVHSCYTVIQFKLGLLWNGCCLPDVT